MDKNVLVQLGCKLKCHRVHGKATAPSRKFIDLLPPQTVLHVQLRGGHSER